MAALPFNFYLRSDKGSATRIDMSSSYSSSHLDRKLLKRPDRFMSVFTNAFDQLGKHFGLFVVTIGACFVLGLAGAYYLSYRESQAQVTNNLLYLAKKSIEVELSALPGQKEASQDGSKEGAQGAFKDVSKESISFKKLDIDAQIPKSVQKLKELEQAYPSSRAAYESRLILGALYYDHGDYAKALPWYEKAVQSAPKGLEKALSLISLGHTQANLDKQKEAIQSYQKGVELGEGDSIKGEALLGMARSYEALQDTARARSVYDQIISELSNTEYQQAAEIFKSQLKN
jgi:tetratricopeptide (TPR) repeat protein